MHADEEFRSRLRDELQIRSAPPLGTLPADALNAGQRLRLRQRTLRAMGGTAAVVAVAVGSATASGAFGSNSPASAAGPGGVRTTLASSSPVPGGPLSIPPTWTVPPPAAVSNPEWVTPRAAVAKILELLPAGASSSDYSGMYGWMSPQTREKWNVDADMTVTTAKGPAQLDVVLYMIDAEAVKTLGEGCTAAKSCASKTFPDGTVVIVQHDFDPIRTGKPGAYVRVVRKDGMNVQVSVRDQSMWTDDQLFTVASSGAWGSLKMDKTFVGHAEATIKGDFKDPPA